MESSKLGYKSNKKSRISVLIKQKERTPYLCFYFNKKKVV